MSNRIFIALFIIITSRQAVNGQQTVVIDSPDARHRIVVAGMEYQAGGLKQFLWGKNYRQEWTTPFRVQVLDIDTAHGGLTPLELGGGRQTKSLHLEDAQGRRWVLRTVNKTYTLALPEILRGTFLEDIANDQISTNHPFAALTIPPMASAAGVYHANPKMYLVAPSPRLGEFLDIFANTLCLLEERPDDTHTAQPSFGLPKDIDGSNRMVENVTNDNDYQVDQHWYVKTRLFDIFAGDWGRHIDNWRWAQFDSAGMDIYRPVPKDRDQTQARFQGVLFNLLKSLADMKQLQTFRDTIRNIERYNFPALEIDRRFTNSLSRQVWIDSARALQKYLTDAVIENAVRQMPPEIFAISGEETIRNLKSRRDDLPDYASRYYDFLTLHVDIPGSRKHEYFHIRRLNDDETEVTIYKITKDAEMRRPLFSRVFHRNETKEIRLYGLDGSDVYKIEGRVDDGIIIRIIGGPGQDSVMDLSRVRGRTKRTRYYDNRHHRLVASPETKIRLDDTLYIYPFNEKYKYDVSGFGVKPGLNTYYRVFVGAQYRNRRHGWRERPYESEIRAGINYSVVERSFHPYLRWTRPHLFSAWNLSFETGFDQARRFNFFGTGNTTQFLNDNRYYWFRTMNFYGRAGLDRDLGRYHNIAMELNYDGVKVWNHEGRFVSKSAAAVDLSTFDWKHFAGAGISYRFLKVNDLVMPTGGLNLLAYGNYAFNIHQLDRDFTTTGAGLTFYIPLFNSFSLSVKSGVETVAGEPEFYQLSHVGGNATLRGYVRNRFWGKTTVYNQKELRWVPDVRSRIMNGKAGFVFLYDHGRVWHPDDGGNGWHSGVGGGIIIVPFNKIFTMATYSVSREDHVINIRLGKFF